MQIFTELDIIDIRKLKNINIAKEMASKKLINFRNSDDRFRITNMLEIFREIEEANNIQDLLSIISQYRIK